MQQAGRAAARSHPVNLFLADLRRIANPGTLAVHSFFDGRVLLRLSLFLPLAAGLVLSSCARTSVMPVSANQFVLSTAAAPACGTTGAQNVALKMAAVETLRRQHDRFMILGANSANNVHVASMPPTGAYTTGTVSGYGNTYYGNSTTTFTGGGPMFFGTHDSSLQVLMLAPGDRGYSNGVDAKGVLGDNWQELVQKGIHSCAE